ncbi:phage/plasmid primase, P4 family [Staphylococcus aureus]|uniref:phage/plasmid primase, P4 family n=2 Tax=Staphylococcus aureus TaxID=1280 RepID=UPI0002423D02|nr:phage/plasmid primase, P4 family [Staphylococcus aureus]HDK9097470.1 DNA primase [Staphylococcus aureus USA500-NRS385E]AIL56855.1 DNA primase [Staphylococcus aureus]AUU64224.1 DNA primase [Staphylococcus aureus]EHM61907.1 phage/plasmid primase, P4 family, C-terminal domain protein [Staphylococcus aureus subsp. aureus 21209]EHT64228.1 phage/plasmid primase, P4 family, C-terminal domain protein [Staphylococcus aureus subsp. aureus CIG1612]
MAIKEKDKILEVNSLEIPDELIELPQWVLWRAEWNEKQQQYSKIPYSYAGYKASSTNSDTWTIFDAINSIYEQNDRYDGIGFVISEHDNYIVLDIDNAIDESSQITSNLALDMTKMTYCEKSPSGTGLHCFFKGELPKERKKKRSDLDIELYDNARFMTMTGESIGQREISDDQSLLNNLVERYFKQEELPETFIGNNITNKSNLDDEDVINIMLKSKQKDKISNLLQGNYEPYFDSPSEAVQSLLHYLAFYTSKDKEQMERIFLNYNNLTDKWGSKRGNTTWGQLELDKAINNQSEVYVKPGKENPPKLIKKGSWWFYPNDDTNRKPKFNHTIMAKFICQEYHIVRYPDADSDIYIYNTQTGIYELDKTGRKLRKIIRSLDNLKDNSVKEVRNYIVDMCDVRSVVNNEYVAVKNGLVHYHTKIFRTFTPDIFVIDKLPTAYNPNAYDEFVDTTIQKVSCNHETTIMNIYEMFAQVLYPKILIDKIIYLLGTVADNGKSTVQHMIKATFDSGGRISSVSPQRLANNHFAGSSIYGKMANMVDDLPNIEIEDAGNIKTAITGGYLEIEQKGKASQSVRMQTPFIIASNHYPKFKESGEQINKRLHIIPFNYSFKDDQERLSVTESTNKIYNKSAKEYVLKLAIDTLADMLQRDGSYITPNERSDKSAELFSDNNNPLSEYLENRNIDFFLNNPGAETYKDYKVWCHSNFIRKPVNKDDFITLLENYYDIEWKRSVKYTENNVRWGFKKLKR